MAEFAILCVDDEQIILTSLEMQLRSSFGNEFLYEFAESVEEANEIIDDMVNEGIRLVIIVSDWLMPGIKGDEFLISVHKRHPEVVKVLLTGQADSEAITRTREEADLHRFLVKPWTEEELKEAILSGVKRCNG